MGFISPLTGPLSPFGESDGYTVEIVKKLLEKGIQNNGKTYEVDILVRDAQSDPNKSAELAGELILNDNVQLLIPASTTDVINSAADQRNSMACRAFRPPPHGRPSSCRAAATRSLSTGPITSSGS